MNPLQTLRRNDNAVVFGTFLFTIIARVFSLLRSPPLWADEASFVINPIRRTFLELMYPLDVNQMSPIGYSWIVKLFGEITHYNEMALRFPAALVSVGVFWLFFRLRKRSDVNPLIITLTLVFLAINPGFLRHSVEVKHYSLDVFFAAWALSVVVAETRLTARHFIIGITAVLLSFSSIFMLFGLIVTMMIERFIARDTRGTVVAAAFGVVWAALFLFFAVYSHAAVREGNMVGAWDHGFISLNDGLFAFSVWVRSTLDALSRHPFGWIMSGLFLFFAALGWAVSKRAEKTIGGAVLGAMVVASALRFYPIVHGRLSLYLLPLATWYAARGIVYVWQKADGIPARTVISILIVVNVLGPWALVPPVVRVQDVPAARDFAKNEPLPMYLYYDARPGWMVYDALDRDGPYPQPVVEGTENPDNPSVYISEIETMLASFDQIYLFFSHVGDGVDGNEYDVIRDRLNRRGYTLESHEFEGAFVVSVSVPE